MTNKMTPIHWLCIVGVGASSYIGFLVGDAADGQITTVSPQLNAAIVVFLAAVLASIVILAGVAKMIGRWVSTATSKLDAMGERIDRNAALLEQTREIPPPRVVGSAAVRPDYTAGYVDGLAAQPTPTNGKLIQLDRR